MEKKTENKYVEMVEKENLALDDELKELKFQAHMFYHELKRLAQFVLFCNDLTEAKNAAGQMLQWLEERQKEGE